MDFPIIRKAPLSSPSSDDGNGPSVMNGAIESRTHHTQERDLPGGANWVVQKFGGTSVGKFAVKIAEDIVLSGLRSHHRIAVVCSARSTGTKAEGTTTRLLRAAKEAEANSAKYVDIVDTIHADHLRAGRDVITNQQDILEKYEREVGLECENLLQDLAAAHRLREVSNLVKDRIMSVGEKLSCLYMTALLQDRGVHAVYVDLSDVVPVLGAKMLDQAFYDNVASALRDRLLAMGDNVVPVMTGYFGRVPGGLLAQIGRGYTDLCAALIAVGLQAEELQIWKEVDGIFTADPRKVPTARLLESVTPSEAAELTFYGSEVIHPFTMDQVIRASIPIRIKNVMNPRGSGTQVVPDPAEEPNSRKLSLFRGRSLSSLGQNEKPKRPTAVTIKPKITVLNVHSKQRTRAHGFLMSIFSTLDKHGLSVDLISSSEVHVSMAIHSEEALLSGEREEEYKIRSESLQGAVEDLEKWGDVTIEAHMAIVSLIGRQLRANVGISGRFFTALAEQGINIHLISQGASEVNISCVIDAANATRALNAVHTNLFTYFLD